jgi:hypothetical protein
VQESDLRIFNEQRKKQDQVAPPVRLVEKLESEKARQQAYDEGRQQTRAGAVFMPAAEYIRNGCRRGREPQNARSLEWVRLPTL